MELNVQHKRLYIEESILKKVIDYYISRGWAVNGEIYLVDNMCVIDFIKK